MPDQTHAPTARSWVPSANGHPYFPLQNLPLGIASTSSGEKRPATAIGDAVLDLKAALHANLLTGQAAAAIEACDDTLNPLFALGAPARQ